MSRGRPLALGWRRPLLLTLIGLIGPSPCAAADTQAEAGGRSLVFVLLTFIIGAWVFGGFIVGRVTGWRRLARRYPPSDRPSGRFIWIGRAWFRRLGYGNLVYLRAGDSHLHFAMFLLARLGHSSFSVAWEDLSASRQRVLWSSRVRFTFAREPDVPFAVLAPVGERIIAASGGRVRLRDDPADGEARPASSSARG